MPIQLTTLNNVRTYLYQVGDQVTADNSLLTLLINQISGAILSNLQRPGIFKTTYTETRDGVGNAVMTLRNYPVLSVSSVTVASTGGGYYPTNYGQSFAGGTQSIPAASQFGYTGYSFDPWDGTAAGQPSKLTLNGYAFWRGQNNVQVVYTAGYSVTNEAYTVTSSSPQQYAALQPYGSWGQDDGVYYSSGAKLTAVSSASSISSAGQYNVTSTTSSTGLYTFSTADSSQVLNINYSFVPTDLEQACIQWVAERYSYRSRIGQKSKSLASQETAAYDMSAIPVFVDTLINPYRRWLPI